MVGADVPHTDVIAHDDEDVGFLVLSLGWSNHAEKRSRGHKQRQAVITYVSFHFRFLVIWFWVCFHDSSPIVLAVVCFAERERAALTSRPRKSPRACLPVIG